MSSNGVKEFLSLVVWLVSFTGMLSVIVCGVGRQAMSVRDGDSLKSGTYSC